MTFLNNGFQVSFCFLLYSLASVAAALPSLTDSNFKAACDVWVDGSDKTTYGPIADWDTSAVRLT